jgi:hypothetical protein
MADKVVVDCGHYETEHRNEWKFGINVLRFGDRVLLKPSPFVVPMEGIFLYGAMVDGEMQAICVYLDLFFELGAARTTHQVVAVKADQFSSLRDRRPGDR